MKGLSRKERKATISSLQFVSSSSLTCRVDDGCVGTTTHYLTVKVCALTL